ncbi:MAG: hypothetical protein R3F31_14735 [Verrucomicrobiales bacterium]
MNQPRAKQRRIVDNTDHQKVLGNARKTLITRRNRARHRKRGIESIDLATLLCSTESIPD